MQIIIDIPDEYMKGPKIENGSLACKKVLDAVYSGTPLPKGHGDLIDKKALAYELKHFGEICLDEALTIIEADGGEE